MKSKLLKIMTVFVVLAIVVFSASAIFADETDGSQEDINLISLDETDGSQGDANLISSDYEILDNNLFKSGEILNLNKTIIEGNAFIAGKDITLNDIKVVGSIAVAGQNINLENVEVTGDIFIAGQILSIEGTTAKNIYGAGQDIELSGQSVVNRDAYIAGATVLLDSQVDKVSVGAGKLKVGAQAVIEELKGELDEAADIDKEAQIGRNTLEVIDVDEEVEEVKKFSVLTIVYDFVKKVIRAIVLALLVACLLLQVKKIDTIKSYTASKIALNGCIGFGVTVFGIIAAVIITFISLTTPLGIALICAYIIAMIFSTAVGSVVVATKLLKDKEKNTNNVIIYTLIASLVIALVDYIPFIGGMIGFVVAMVGIGTMCSILFDKDKNNKIEPDEKVEVVK